MLIVYDHDQHLRALDWEEFAPRMRRLLHLQYGIENIAWHLRDLTLPAYLREPLDAYFAGYLDALNAIALRTADTDFQHAVWQELRRIPLGTILSYGQLAIKIGKPTVVRAVGMANGANPIGVVVPCHRVIGADRSLTGYAGGLHRKSWLLTHEAAFRMQAESVTITENKT